MHRLRLCLPQEIRSLPPVGIAGRADGRGHTLEVPRADSPSADGLTRPAGCPVPTPALTVVSVAQTLFGTGAGEGCEERPHTYSSCPQRSAQQGWSDKHTSSHEAV